MDGGIARRECLGLLGLGAITLYFIATSWLKWPEPLIDFGRELYIPWRLANGAVMYRDADDFYGPLSQYFNAAVFRLFGPGLLVLVAANLLIFVAILAAFYALARMAWGVLAAIVSASVFVAVFGFSQFISRGNYNFATPYAHEATHGLLVCLILVLVLTRWIVNAAPVWSFVSGLLFGLTAVLKPEIMLAAALVTCAAAGMRAIRERSLSWRPFLLWTIGAVLPTGLFWIYFSQRLPWGYSLSLACRAWLNVAGSRGLVSDVVQVRFLGLDQPWAHLGEHALCTFAAMLLLAGLGGAAWLSGRIGRTSSRAAVWVLVLGLSSWLAWSGIDWMHVGRCLLGLTIAYIGYEGAAACRTARSGGKARVEVQRLLIAVLAAGLMARMVLYGRIYHFGFYQAALAGSMISAVLVGEFVPRLGADRPARLLLLTAILLLLGIGTLRLAGQSHRLLGAKTFLVGAGIDRFYAYPSKIDPTAELVGVVSDQLRREPPGSTLLVLPEGEMINYLARMPSPVAPFFFFSAATKDGREDDIVRRLNEHHPDFVVVISRSLREYGVGQYGESYGQGRRIMEWVEAHYRIQWVYGGDPLDSSQYGAVILSWGP